MNDLDKYDLRLLNVLEEDARMPLTQIAKKLHSSQQVVSYRIKSLEQRKIIGEYYTLIDISRLGYTSYRTLIRLSNIDSEKKEEIIEYLMKHPNVLWLVDVGGRWDLLVNFLAKNIIQYYNLLSHFRSKFPNQIQNYDILTTIGGHYFGRSYFMKESRKAIKTLKFGIVDPKMEKIDELDLKVLFILSRNARENAVRISEKVKTSPNTVILRIKELKKKEIIQGFKPLIHLDKIDVSGYKALIKFQNITENKEKEMFRHLYENPHVVGALKLVGLWDFEVEFEVEKKEQMLSIVREIRDMFKDIIKDLEILPLYHEYKYNFFPGDLLGLFHLDEFTVLF